MGNTVNLSELSKARKMKSKKEQLAFLLSSEESCRTVAAFICAVDSVDVADFEKYDLTMYPLMYLMFKYDNDLMKGAGDLLKYGFAMGLKCAKK